MAKFNHALLVPDLKLQNLLSMQTAEIYEVRMETEHKEFSATYLHSDESNKAVAEDWPTNAAFTAATLTWESHLITAFNDGQLLLQDLRPSEVARAVASIGPELWQIKR